MHTPTPWHVNELLPSGRQINSGYGPIAVTITSEDAAFIVQACNAHDALVAALQAALPYLKSYAIYTYGGKDYDAALSKVHSALALAEPKEAVR